MPTLWPLMHRTCRAPGCQSHSPKLPRPPIRLNWKDPWSLEPVCPQKRCSKLLVGNTGSLTLIGRRAVIIWGINVAGVDVYTRVQCPKCLPHVNADSTIVAADTSMSITAEQVLHTQHGCAHLYVCICMWMYERIHTNVHVYEGMFICKY